MCSSDLKSDSKKRHNELIKDSAWMEKEKERSRQKYHRLNYKEKYKPSAEKKKAIMQRYYERYPEKTKSRSVKVNSVAGFHRHHWSYKPEHVNDILLLSIADHNYLHRHIVYDQERMMYRRSDNNVLLDTKEAHEDYFKKIKTME